MNSHKKYTLLIREMDETCHRMLTKIGTTTHHVVPIEEPPLPQKKEEVWRSCCFDLSPNGVAYTGQLIVTISVLGISTMMLVKANGNCEQSASYIGLISFVCGKILSSVITSQRN